MRRKPYVMDVNRKRNCYSCGGFGHLVWNCRNQKIIGQEKRMEYRDNVNNVSNLKKKENLVVLD